MWQAWGTKSKQNIIRSDLLTRTRRSSQSGVTQKFILHEVYWTTKGLKLRELESMHSMKLSLVSFLITLMLLYEADGDIVTVRTKYGDIRGTVKVAPPIYGSAVTSVNTFLGIPFAAPPVGELRFQPPKPAQSWKPSVYDATSFRKVCIQKRELFEEAFKKVIPNFGKSNYGEDCLYLNVYAPAQNDSLNPSTKCPVMVYIHGGGFVVGSAIVNDGLGLSTYGVVVVTIQYRLGPFGFLSTGDSAAPGNYGMLDQVQALKWVKENIKNFGGDPDKITIIGLSAGGASVSLHLLSRLSANLFHRAISESGVYLSPWAVASPQVAKSRTVQLGKKDWVRVQRTRQTGWLLEEERRLEHNIVRGRSVVTSSR